MGLVNAKEAAAMFARSQYASFTQAIKWNEHIVSCGTGGGTGTVWWYCAGIQDEPLTATPIGYDDTNCIAYYHLTDMQMKGMIRDVTEGCASSPIPGFPSSPVTTVDSTTPGSSQGIALGDNGSSASPIDGQKHFSYSGYPVCAAIRAPSGDDYAIAAGAASSLSMADAAAACGTSSLAMCGGGCDDIDIVINVT